MARPQQSVSDTVEWLSFPAQAYPNFYLNVERIRHRFRGYLGSIRDFSHSAQKSANVSAKLNLLFGEAGIGGGGATQAEIAWDLTDPLAQALVLRAYLATVGELHTDPRAAPTTGFVLARGRGGIVRPHDVADSTQWGAHDFGPAITGEVAAEQARQSAMGSGADPAPLYWATYAKTGSGLVVSLLGDASVIGTDVRSYAGLDMTYCIFGQKVRDGVSWTLVSALHVWIEPPGSEEWG